MDKTIVGNNAGKVWYALKEIGEISIPELARRLNLSVESTALAAGWLARENKICIPTENGFWRHLLYLPFREVGITHKHGFVRVPLFRI